jgi:hypothetical protein
VKSKDIIQLGVAIVIFAIAGFIIYNQLAPNKKGAAAKGVEVERITSIPSQFDSSALASLSDSSKSRDFYNQPDLKSGLGNTQPFGPLR